MSDLDLPTPSSPITSATRAALSAVEISDSPLAPVKRGRGRPAADPNAPKPPPREKQPTKTKKVQKEEKIGIDVGCFVVAMLRCHLGPFPPSARLGTKNEADEIRFPANRI
jgi:flagellar hook-length control protein FliK